MKDFSPIVLPLYTAGVELDKRTDTEHLFFKLHKKCIILTLLNGARVNRVSYKVTLTSLQNDFSGDLDTMELDLVGSGGHLVGSGGDHAHNSQSHHHFSAQHSFQNLLEDISTEENIDIPIMVNISRFFIFVKIHLIIFSLWESDNFTKSEF